MLDRAQRRWRGSWKRRSPARERCTIHMGSWWLTMTTSPSGTERYAAFTASAMRAAMER
ncbi:hypothetical protein CMMCAS07_16485 [Clavibacter michiganensis subsp. michiganensis]|uniref:Uncharacterized protein n=1 Tax=Clavibacter michiganensis subsp. michiganensis TaxID=33013 RepID=A0A251XF40_CLAMM|nr:hypothetical protein CMMCAS07_16485 [Clavibacter michiganensis subsp. michiganensis]